LSLLYLLIKISPQKYKK